jgi:hypothetical protein
VEESTKRINDLEILKPLDNTSLPLILLKKKLNEFKDRFLHTHRERERERERKKEIYIHTEYLI